MAKIYGLNGLIKGRQGNNVFSIQNGTQVLKVYNPNVANPRTIGQREQRSKFALAGRLSAATPSFALAGIAGSSNRARRARFVSMVVKGSSVTGDASALTAAIPLSSIRWSEGGLSRYSNFFTATAVYDSYNVVVTIPAMSVVSGAPAGYGEMVIVGLFDPQGRALDEVQAVIRSTASAATLSFRETPSRVAVSVAVFVCPFKANTAAAAPNNSFLYAESGNLSLRSTATSVFSGYDWGTSQSVSVIEVTPASTSIAPSPSDDEGSERSVKKKGMHL